MMSILAIREGFLYPIMGFCLRIGMQEDHDGLHCMAESVVYTHLSFRPLLTMAMVVPFYVSQIVTQL